MKKNDVEYEEIFIADNKIEAEKIAKECNPSSKILQINWTYK
tara:strand:- start:369 stop:494 length:126 start_codon:yes stop_codon:yes gene_type:complete